MLRQLFSVPGFSLPLLLSLSTFVYRRKSRMPRASTLLWPVTSSRVSCVSFGSYAGLSLTRNYQCDIALVQRSTVVSEVAVSPERGCEYLPNTAIARVAGERIEDNASCENSRHWLAGIPESERKSLSRNSRAAIRRVACQSLPHFVPLLRMRATPSLCRAGEKRIARYLCVRACLQERTIGLVRNSFSFWY